MVVRTWCPAAALGLALVLLVGCGGPQQGAAPGPSPSSVEQQSPEEAAKIPAEIPAVPAVKKEIPFSDSVKLMGYSLSKVANGQTQLVLYWQCLKPMSADYTVFIHLFPADRSALTSDRQKAGYANMDNTPRAATSTWQPGKTYISLHRTNLNPATYKTAIGLYSREKGKTVRVTPASGGTAGTPEKGTITIGPLDVK